MAESIIPLPCRFMTHLPADGAWNMGVDEALLQAAEQEPAAVLRLYQWSEPTVSLGYFQSHTARREHPPSQRCPLTRRMSGGGAIMHDRELTYLLLLPEQHLHARDRLQLYHTVHSSLVALFSTWQVEASLCEQESPARRGEQPFLCFERRAAGDVLLAGAKIVGSAQRRRRGMVLQHGSILLSASPAAPELPGINDLAGTELTPAAMETTWPTILAERLALTLEASKLTTGERHAACQLAEQKYASASFVARL